jgi:hypothetical protein
MKQIQYQRTKHRRERADAGILPRDPRDPDIVRAKALSRAARRSAASPTANDACRTRGA